MKSSSANALTGLAIGITSAVTIFAVHRAARSGGEERIEAPAAPLEPRGAPSPSSAGGADGRGRSGVETAASSVHARALRHPSDSFRNTSLAIVIREAGHECSEVVGSAPAAEDLGSWRVSCDDAKVYLVSDDGAGGLIVDLLPMVEAPVKPPIRVEPQPVPPDPREQLIESR